MMHAMAFRPLAGIRVLDLTSSLAGPTATEILGALGADVLKIEHPGRGDEARDWGPRFFEGVKHAGDLVMGTAQPLAHRLADEQ